MLTCTLVSFFHGSNDGQKGMGLMMLILVGLVPAAFALNLANDPARLQATAAEMIRLGGHGYADGQRRHGEPGRCDCRVDPLRQEGRRTDRQDVRRRRPGKPYIADKLGKIPGMESLAREERVNLRTEIYLVAESLGKLINGKRITDPTAVCGSRTGQSRLGQIVKYIPTWVKVAVAIALGMGTMIGWKRIVVTVGEKIGKSHLTYAQGACGRTHGRGYHRIGRFHGTSRQHDPRPLLGHRRQHGGQPIRPAEGHLDQHPAGLGADIAGLHLPGRDDLLDGALHDAPRLRDPIRPGASRKTLGVRTTRVSFLGEADDKSHVEVLKPQAK